MSIMIKYDLTANINMTLLKSDYALQIFKEGVSLTEYGLANVKTENYDTISWTSYRTMFGV